MESLNVGILAGGLLIAVGVTVALVYKLATRDSKPGKMRQWLRGIWDAISTMLGA